MPARLEALAAAYREHAAAALGGGAEAIQRAEAKVQQAQDRVRELAGPVVTVDYSGLPPEVQRKLGVPRSPEEELQRGEDAARKDRERLDALVHEERETLLCLTRKGANPAFILSVLIRYAGKRTTEFPEPLTIVTRGKLFTDYALEAERPLPLAEGAPACVTFKRVTFKKHQRTSGRENRRKPGPAELAVSAGMALLHRHFSKSTGFPHLKEIGVLFAAGGANLGASTFGPSVDHRVRRLRTKYGKNFGQLIRYERTLFRAHTGTDLAL